MDLQLVASGTTIGPAQFGLIASILEKHLDLRVGPFVIVLWTNAPQYAGELKAYLDANIRATPHALPLAVVPLEKTQFLSQAGTILPTEELLEAVRRVIRETPQIAVMLEWEADVISAAGHTLAELLELVRSRFSAPDKCTDGLDEMLSRLVQETIGMKNIGSDKRSAISIALAPLLIDRLLNQPSRPDSKDAWDLALSKCSQNLPKLTQAEAGRVNRMLHIALPRTEVIRPTDWGATVSIPPEWESDTEMTSRFGRTKADLLLEVYKMSSEKQARCKLRLIRVGAACDYAQGKEGPIPYLLGVEIPSEIAPSSPAGLPWVSPVFSIDADKEPFKLFVNAIYLISVTGGATLRWSVAYRLREQLLMELIHKAAEHNARPGIVKMP
jgi:hypothetical protein